MRTDTLPSSLGEGPFATQSALAAGVEYARLRRADLARPFHGVRVLVEGDASPELLDSCRAFRTRMPPAQFFSHTSAAAIYGIPTPRRLHDSPELHVSVLAPRRAPKGGGIVGHKLAAASTSIRMHAGLPVPAPTEVWCELASMLDVDELVQAGDALVRRQAPLAELWELYPAVDAASNRPGVERLRLALPLVRARTDSPMETSLRLAIMRSGLPEPRVNPPICDERGEFVAFGDLVFPEWRVVVEYDGDHHRSDREQYYGDTDRLWNLERLGWRVVRINRTHMFENAREAVSRVRQTLAAP